MQLPVIRSDPTQTPETLVRLFYQSELHQRENLAEERVSLEFCGAQWNRKLDRIHVANCVFDVAIPESLLPARAMQIVIDHYAAMGLRCYGWMMNPSAPAAHTGPMVAHLRELGFVADRTLILRATRSTIAVNRDPAVRIIPARASFRHAAQIYDQMGEKWNEPQVAEAHLLQLDDPRIDSLIALDGDVAVAHISVHSNGELGRIEDVFVAPSHRRRGIARLMLSRAMEICARSLFKDVLLGVDPENAIARALYESAGFVAIGEYDVMQKV